MKWGINTVRFVLIACILLVSGVLSWGATVSWTGGDGSSDNWSVATNWTGGVPVSNDVIQFNSGSTARLTTGANNLTLNGITINFTNPSADVTISGNAIGLASGNGINMSTASRNFRINNTLTFGGDQVWNVNGGYTLHIGSQLPSYYGLAKRGSGTLVLSASQEREGGTGVEQGVLRLQNGFAGEDIYVTTGAAVELAGGVNITAPLRIEGSGIGNNGSLRNISGNNTVSEQYIALHSDPVTIQSDAGLLTIAVDIHCDDNGNYSLTVQGAGNGVISGAIQSGSGSVNKNGTGTWTLSGTNTYTGPTRINAGTLSITGSTAAGSAVSVNNTGTLTGTGLINGSLTVNSGGTVDPGVGTTAGRLRVNGAVTFASGSTCRVRLTGNNMNDTLVAGGSCNLGSATLSLDLAYAPSAGHTYRIVDKTSTGAFTGTFNGLTEGAQITALFGGTTYHFTISYVGGTGNDVVLTCGSPKAWTGGGGNDSWSTSANWSGGVPTNNDLLLFNSGSTARHTTGANDLTLTGATIQFTNPPADITISGNPIGLAAGSGINMSSASRNFRINNNLTFSGNQTWAVAGNYTLHVAGSMSGTQSITKSGSGTLRLSGSNTHSGGTTLSAGTLLVTNTGGSGTGTGTVTVNGGTLGGTGTIGGAVTVNSGATVNPGVDNNSGNLTINGNLTLASGSTARIRINGNSDHDRLTVGGASCNLGSATLSLDLAYAPSVGDTFRILDKTSTGAITGTFNGLAQGAQISAAFGGTTYGFAISYSGGTGNDVVLTCGIPPSVTSISPTRAEILVGQSATFTVAATGPDIQTYQWQKQGAGQVGTNSAQLTITNATLADSGRYQCVVANAVGQAASPPCTLVVLEPVKAAFTLSPQSAVDSATVTFTDQSTGSIAQWRWYFGDSQSGAQDSLIYTTPPTTIRHTYARTGQYTVTLVVIGTGIAGRDAIKSAPIIIYAQSDNPLRISGRTSAGAKVEVTIDSARKVSTNPLQPPHADSIGVWFGRTGLPVDTTRPPLKKFRTLDVQVQTSFTTILDVPAPTGPGDTVYGFWVSPVWNSTGRPSPYSDINACAVRMAAVNQLTVKGTYPGNAATLPSVQPDPARKDSALITVGNLGSVDTALTGRVVLTYEMQGSGGRDTLSGAALLSAVASGQYVWRVYSPLFLNDTQRVVAAAVQIGRNGLVSSAVRDTFVTGWPLPVNPCTLSVVPGQTKASRISLRWSPAGQVDSIRILYGTTQVPLGRPSLAGYEVLYPPVTETTLDVTGLAKETRYHFALQIYKNLQWSTVTAASRASDSTTAVDPNDLVENTVVIDSAWFDPTINRFRVRWTLELIPGIELEVGIVHNLDSLQAGIREPEAGYGRVIPGVTSTSGEAVIDPGAGLRFDAVYHIAIWLRSSNGPWSPPTQSSRRAVSVPPFSWQAVALFGSGVDTVSAVGGMVLFRKDPTHVVQIDDTVDVYRPQTLPSDFTAVGVGFSLRRYDDPLPGFYIGFRYDTLPAGVTVAELGIYRISGAELEVLHGFQNDTVNRIVWVKTSDFRADDGAPKPYLLLADRRRPGITVRSDTASAVDPFRSVGDTVQVIDNISNVAWKLWYARGGEPFSLNPSSSGVICGTCTDDRNLIRATVPDNLVNDETGVRVRLIVSDGVYHDTLDLSRQVRRTFSDAVTTTEMDWVPLSTTAHLESPGVRDALRDLSTAGEWKYDIHSFRLVTWSTVEGREGEWVEYSPAVEDLFRFVPGRIVWVKTRRLTALNLGSGVTVSQKAPFTVNLPARAWSDVASVFRFDVPLSEVLGATGDDGDSLEFYRWVQQPDKQGVNRYLSEPLYVGTVPGLDDPTQSLSSVGQTGYGGAYTVYNPLNRPVPLRIVPVSPAMSSSGRAKRLAHRGFDGDWSVRVVSRTREGRHLNMVYCGMRRMEGESRFHPRAPGFSPVWVGVWDHNKTRLHGHAVLRGTVAGGALYNIAFINSSGESEQVEYRLERVRQVPREYEVRVIDPVSGRVEGAESDVLSVAIPAGGREERILAVGTARFIGEVSERLASSRFGLLGFYPGPFRGGMRIRYSLPAAGVTKVHFAVHDMRGRIVWSRPVTAQSAGMQTIGWDGRTDSGLLLPPGVYTLSMTGYDHSSRTVGVHRMKLTWLP